MLRLCRGQRGETGERERVCGISRWVWPLVVGRALLGSSIFGPRDGSKVVRPFADLSGS